MRQHLLHLYEIQKLDLDIRSLQKDHESVAARLQQLDLSLDGLKTQLGSLNEQRATVARDAQQQRLLVEEEGDKIRKWEARLNDIRNQREYQALSRETEGSKRANRDAEGKISELMASRDALDGQLEALNAKIEAEEAIRAEESGRVSAILSAGQAQLETMRTRRDSLIPQVPSTLRRRYESIRSRRMGVGLATVTAGTCTGCNMRLPPQLYNILQRSDSLEQCPSCSRIIMWDQLLVAPESSAAEAQIAP